MRAYDEVKVRRAMERQEARQARSRDRWDKYEKAHAQRVERRRERGRVRYASLTNDELEFVKERRETRILIVMLLSVVLSLCIAFAMAFAGNVPGMVTACAAVLASIAGIGLFEDSGLSTADIDCELERRREK